MTQVFKPIFFSNRTQHVNGTGRRSLSVSNINKDNFFSEVYKDQAEFALILICSSLGYASSVMFVFVSMSALIPENRSKLVLIVRIKRIVLICACQSRTLNKNF